MCKNNRHQSRVVLLLVETTNDEHSILANVLLSLVELASVLWQPFNDAILWQELILTEKLHDRLENVKTNQIRIENLKNIQPKHQKSMYNESPVMNRHHSNDRATHQKLEREFLPQLVRNAFELPLPDFGNFQFFVQKVNGKLDWEWLACLRM